MKADWNHVEAPWHFGTPERDPAELAEESARRRAEAMAENRARQPPTTNPLAAAPRITVEAATDRLPPALERALANPRRLNTRVRQCAAFLRQLPRCSTIAEAAARANVNRGTLYRWRAKHPRFAQSWDNATRRHAGEVSDNIVLRAGHPETHPVFRGGRRIAERQRYNDRLQIHVQKRLDAERHRAEDRAERRELALLRNPAPAPASIPAIDETALTERLLALIEQRQLARSQPAAPAATPAAGDCPSKINDVDGGS